MWFFWRKLPSCTVDGKRQPLAVLWIHPSQHSPFLRTKGPFGLYQTTRALFSFFTWDVEKKMLSETVPPFKNSKYIRELLLFFKITGIFLGNYSSLGRAVAFHVFLLLLKCVLVN